MPIRITGGQLRGRLVPSPSTSKTRPTGSRTREALFNILQSVEHFRMLDLFAGSGIMGIEAISRGAECVVAVEKAHLQARLIADAYRSLQLSQKLVLLESDVLTLSKESLCSAGGFDMIYADPPFKDMEYPDLRPFLSWLNAGGVAVFEVPSHKVPAWALADESAKIARIRKYGESSLVLYRL